MENKGLDFKTVGKRFPRIDGIEKVTGFAKYVDDMELPGMLYGKILGSPHAHAKILSIDKSKAEALPGVIAIVTGKDIPNNKGVMGLLLNDEPVLAAGKVHYVGDAIAAVAATSEEIAEQAIGLIDVEYEVLPYILNPEEAMKSGAIRIHDEAESNIAAIRKVKIGDVEAGLKASDYVFEGKFRSNLIDQTPTEREAAIVVFEPDGGMTIWGTIQQPNLDVAVFSRCYGIPRNKIRLIAPTVAGAYGSRTSTRVHYITAGLARKVGVGRPVKIVYSREEEFICTSVQRDYTHHFTIGVTEDGKINALKSHGIFDAGAYADYALLQAEYTRTEFGATYNAPNVSCDFYVVYTNKPYSGALRGFGDTQLFWGWEQVISAIAEKLKMGQLEFRLKNVFRDGEYVPIVEKEMVAFSLAECLEKCAESIGVDKKPLTCKVDDTTVRAIGLASGNHQCGWRVGFNSMIWRTGAKTPEELYEMNPAHPALVRTSDGNLAWRPGFEVVTDKRIGRDVYDADPSSCLIKMAEDGSVVLYIAEPDYGNGSQTTMAIIAAEELGIDPLDIKVYCADSSYPYTGLGTFASRLTMTAGKAVQRAAVDLREQLLNHAVAVFRDMGRIVTPEHLELRDGKVYIKRTDQFIWIADVAYRAYAAREGGHLIAKGYYDPPSVVAEVETGKGLMAIDLYGCAAAVELEINLETGAYKIIKVAMAYDSGTVINLLGAEGQAQGALAQGIGFACTENMAIDKKGRVLNPNFLKNHLVTSQMVPEADIFFVEKISVDGPYGAKGFGEGGIVPVPAAIACAIRNALGIYVEELPITPERVFKLVQKSKVKIG